MTVILEKLHEPRKIEWLWRVIRSPILQRIPRLRTNQEDCMVFRIPEIVVIPGSGEHIGNWRIRFRTALRIRSNGGD